MGACGGVLPTLSQIFALFCTCPCLGLWIESGARNHASTHVHVKLQNVASLTEVLDSPLNCHNFVLKLSKWSKTVYFFLLGSSNLKPTPTPHWWKSSSVSTGQKPWEVERFFLAVHGTETCPPCFVAEILLWIFEQMSHPPWGSH